MHVQGYRATVAVMDVQAMCLRPPARQGGCSFRHAAGYIDGSSAFCFNTVQADVVGTWVGCSRWWAGQLACGIQRAVAAVSASKRAWQLHDPESVRGQICVQRAAVILKRGDNHCYEKRLERWGGSVTGALRSFVVRLSPVNYGTQPVQLIASAWLQVAAPQTQRGTLAHLCTTYLTDCLSPSDRTGFRAFRLAARPDFSPAVL